MGVDMGVGVGVGVGVSYSFLLTRRRVAPPPVVQVSRLELVHTLGMLDRAPMKEVLTDVGRVFALLQVPPHRPAGAPHRPPAKLAPAIPQITSACR